MLRTLVSPPTYNTPLDILPTCSRVINTELSRWYDKGYPVDSAIQAARGRDILQIKSLRIPPKVFSVVVHLQKYNNQVQVDVFSQVSQIHRHFHCAGLS